MRPNKIEHVSKFHTSLLGENNDHRFVILEIKEDVKRPRGNIKSLNTSLRFSAINTILLDNLEVVEVDTFALAGHQVTINKTDC